MLYTLPAPSPLLPTVAHAAQLQPTARFLPNSCCVPASPTATHKCDNPEPNSHCNMYYALLPTNKFAHSPEPNYSPPHTFLTAMLYLLPPPLPMNIICPVQLQPHCNTLPALPAHKQVFPRPRAQLMPTTYNAMLYLPCCPASTAAHK